MDHLSPITAQLDVLGQLYMSGVEACGEETSPAYKALHLLEEMFIMLTQLGNLGEDRHQLVRLPTYLSFYF